MKHTEFKNNCYFFGPSFFVRVEIDGGEVELQAYIKVGVPEYSVGRKNIDEKTLITSDIPVKQMVYGLAKDVWDELHVSMAQSSDAIRGADVKAQPKDGLS